MLPAMLAAVCLHSAGAQEGPPRRGPAGAAGRSAREPALVLSLKSYDVLKEDLGYLFQASGQPQAAALLDGLLHVVTRGRGPAGLDTSRPLGAMIQDLEAEPLPLLFVPVSDEEQALALLSQLLPVEKTAGEIFRVSARRPFFVKLAGRWAFAALKPEQLQVLPPDPLVILGSGSREHHLALTVRVQALPSSLRQTVEAGLLSLQNQEVVRRPGQSSEHHHGQLAGQRLSSQVTIPSIRRFLAEGKEVRLGVSLSRPERRAVIDLTATAIPGSESARSFKEIEGTTSRFGFLLDGRPALALSLSLPLGDLLAQSLGELLYTARARNPSAGGTPEGRWLGRLLEMIDANVRSGRLEGVFVLRVQSPERLSIVAAGRLLRAQELNELIDEISRRASPLSEAVDIQPGVATHKGAPVHRVRLRAAPQEWRRAFGPEPTLHLAFAADLAFLALGGDSLGDVKWALDAATSPRNLGRRQPPFLFELRAGQLLPFAGALAGERRRLLEESLARDDRLSLAIEAIPDGSRLRIELEEGWLRLLGTAFQRSPGRAPGAAGRLR
jgi:hypothetical protein